MEKLQKILVGLLVVNLALVGIVGFNKLGEDESVVGETVASNITLTENYVQSGNSLGYAEETSVLQVDASAGTVDVTGTFDVSGAMGFGAGITYDTESAGSANLTLTAASGNIVFMGASSSVYAVTLPAATAGLQFKFIVSGAMTGVSEASTTIDSAEGDNITGTMDVNEADVDCSAEDSISIANTLESIGDYIELASDGTSWFISDSQVATAAAFTCVDPS